MRQNIDAIGCVALLLLFLTFFVVVLGINVAIIFYGWNAIAVTMFNAKTITWGQAFWAAMLVSLISSAFKSKVTFKNK